ncbi:MAG: FRG domain-containing protein [Bryobacteraceae bacterium]|jgi:hypothetical protein
MKEIDVGDWQAFQQKLRDLRDGLGQGSSPLLFRGQGNSEWQLKTTLERAGRDRMKFSGYYELISRIRPVVETFTESNWEFPDYSGEETEASFRDYDAFSHFPSVPAYAYMVYLRHHGFPSPLLDWSRSPSVAAFFAFREPYPDPGNRSIYVFCEMPRGLKAWSNQSPRIRRIGPYVRSHRRHFRQQSDYTICARFEQTWHFWDYESVFVPSTPVPIEQDVLWKFNLPSTQRVAVLRSFDEYNLNAFSLFDSEEALLETMWLRELTLREK